MSKAKRKDAAYWQALAAGWHGRYADLNVKMDEALAELTDLADLVEALEIDMRSYAVALRLAKTQVNNDHDAMYAIHEITKTARSTR
jgi:hypothetical protein